MRRQHALHEVNILRTKGELSFHSVCRGVAHDHCQQTFRQQVEPDGVHADLAGEETLLELSRKFKFLPLPLFSHNGLPSLSHVLFGIRAVQRNVDKLKHQPTELGIVDGSSIANLFQREHLVFKFTRNVRIRYRDGVARKDSCRRDWGLHAVALRMQCPGKLPCMFFGVENIRVKFADDRRALQAARDLRIADGGFAKYFRPIEFIAGKYTLKAPEQ